MMDENHPASNYVLLAVIAGVFICFFALDRGGTEPLLWIALALAGGRFVYGGLRVREIPTAFWGMAAVVLALGGISLAFSYDLTKMDRLLRLGKSLIPVLALYILGRGTFNTGMRGLLWATLALTILWQFSARTFWNLPYGTFENPHYLASMAAITLPLIFYGGRELGGRFLPLFLVLGLLDLDLLLRSGSRPAMLALLGATLLVVFVFASVRQKLFAMASAGALAAFLVISKYAGTAARMEDLLVNLSREERVGIWTESWHMIWEGSLLARLVGHGIGSFASAYPRYGNSEFNFLSFPHNYVLQLLYENGIWGASIVLAGLIALVILLVRLLRQAPSGKERLWASCLLVIFLVWLGMSNLTFGFYSKYTLYPLGFLVGAVLASGQSLAKSPVSRPGNDD